MMLPSSRVLAVATAIASLVLLASGSAHADESDGEAPREPDALPAESDSGHASDLLVAAGAGAFSDSSEEKGGVLSLTALHQREWLGIGGTFEYGSAIFGYSHVTVAPMIGVFAPGARWLRAGIAATAGVHVYRGVGTGFLTDDPGVDGTMGFVGARVLLGVELGGANRFHIGLQGAIDNDLSRRHANYTYQESSWFGGGTTEQSASHTVGFLRLGAMLALGGAFDL